MAHSDKPIGHAIHFCDVCEGELVAEERPLSVVLMGYLTS